MGAPPGRREYLGVLRARNIYHGHGSRVHNLERFHDGGTVVRDHHLQSQPERV
jgi:hypothetical protein